MNHRHQFMLQFSSDKHNIVWTLFSTGPRNETDSIPVPCLSSTSIAITAVVSCAVIHYCSTGWCCGALLKKCDCQKFYSLAIARKQQHQCIRTLLDSSEHWTEGECCIWPCATLKMEDDYGLYSHCKFTVDITMSQRCLCTLSFGKLLSSYLRWFKCSTSAWLC